MQLFREWLSDAVLDNKGDAHLHQNEDDAMIFSGKEGPVYRFTLTASLRLDHELPSVLEQAYQVRCQYCVIYMIYSCVCVCVCGGGGGMRV